MHPFRQSLVISLIAVSAPILPAAAVSGDLDLKAVMTVKDAGSAAPSFLLGVGKGLSKALPLPADYTVETNSISELKPAEPMNLPKFTDKSPEEAAAPPVPVIAVVSKDAAPDSITEPPSNANAKPADKDKPKSTRVRKHRIARRTSAATTSAAYQVPTNAIIRNELSHSAKGTRRLAGEP